MYSVHGDIYHFENAWRESLGLGTVRASYQATLSQPLYTFVFVRERGRDQRRVAGRAARRRGARLRETRNVVAWETRKLYYTLLFARSLKPVLDEARDQVTTAYERAQELYASGAGEVAQSDVSRLRFSLPRRSPRGSTLADKGAFMALAALKQTMGLTADAVVVIADSHLAPITDDDGP